MNMKDILHSDIKDVIKYLTKGDTDYFGRYVYIALLIYSSFPLVNYLRRTILGGDLYFLLWRDYMMLFAYLGFVVLFFIRKRYSNPLLSLKQSLSNVTEICFLCLTLWMVISVIANGLDWYNVFGGAKARTGLMAFCCFLLYFAFSKRWHNENQKYTWVNYSLLISGVISLIIIVSCYADGNNGIIDEGTFFYHKNHLAYYLNVMALLAYNLAFEEQSHKKMYFYILVYGLCLTALIYSDTLGCCIGFAFGFIFTYVVRLICKKLNFKRAVLMIVVTVIVVALFIFIPKLLNIDGLTDMLFWNVDEIGAIAESVTDIENAGNDLGTFRLGLWRSAMKIIKQHPLFGLNVSGVRDFLYNECDQTTVHNEFLEYVTDYGIPALVFYFAGAFSVFLRGLKYRKKLTNLNIVGLCTAFGYLVSSFTGVTMFYTAPFMFILLAFGYYQECTATDFNPTELAD